MKDLKKIGQLWTEVQEKEDELSEIISYFEGRQITHRGKQGYIHKIDPANEMAEIVFVEGGTQSMHLSTFY
jgi:hypothetical protein